MGDPGPVLELQGKKGLDQGWGHRRHFLWCSSRGSADHMAERSNSSDNGKQTHVSLWQLVGRSLGPWASGDKEDYFFNLLSLLGPCCSLLVLPLTLLSHTRHLVCYPAWPVPRVQLSAQLLQSGQAFPAYAPENSRTLPQSRPLSSAPGAE